jgi:hypothetical protein
VLLGSLVSRLDDPRAPVWLLVLRLQRRERFLFQAAPLAVPVSFPHVLPAAFPDELPEPVRCGLPSGPRPDAPQDALPLAKLVRAEPERVPLAASARAPCVRY